METTRLIIRPFTAADADDLYAYLSREEVVRYEPYPPFTREQAAEEAARRANDPNFYAVVLKETPSDSLPAASSLGEGAMGCVIGNLYFAHGDFDTWELGYVFHDAYWGRGYAAEACRALLAEGFGSGKVRRVIAMCNPENTASWRLMERLGMRRESHLRKNIWFFRDENGRPIWQDTYEYAILREEWEEQAKA